MDGVTIKKIILPCIMLGFCALYTHQICAKQADATHEINTLDSNNQSTKDAIIEQAVLGNFANIVQNFFSIVQNPHNVVNVGANISQILAGIVNVAVEVMKHLPADICLEERAAFIKNLELTLKASLRALAGAKKDSFKTLIAI